MMAMMMMMIRASDTLPEVRSGQCYGISEPFLHIFTYVTSLSLPNMYVSPICGQYSRTLYQTAGKNLSIVLQGSEGKLCNCVFARSHVIGCVCLLTESVDQGQAPRGTPWDHLSNPVTLKPSCMSECLESLLKN